MIANVARARKWNFMSNVDVIVTMGVKKDFCFALFCFMRNLLTVAAACLRVLGHARSHYQEEKRRVGGGLPADYASLSSRRT